MLKVLIESMVSFVTQSMVLFVMDSVVNICTFPSGIVHGGNGAELADFICGEQLDPSLVLFMDERVVN